MFAQRLKELRKECGLTQTQFAQRLNVSNGAVGMWETGKREPDFDTISQLANFFHVSVDYLLGNVSEPFFHLDNERILREMNSYGDEDEKAPTPEGERQPSDEDIKFALFGGSGEITDAMFDEVKNFAAYVKQREEGKRKG